MAITKKSARQRRKEEDAAVEEAERALLARALGMTHKESYAEELVDKKSGELLEVIKRRTVEKNSLPDVRALLFFLRNRRPERWKDRIGEEGGGEEINLDLDETEKEL